MDIVHNYKGFEICKREGYTSTYYIIKGIKEEVFLRLKDAKSYIDKLEGRNDK